MTFRVDILYSISLVLSLCWHWAQNAARDAFKSEGANANRVRKPPTDTDNLARLILFTKKQTLVSKLNMYFKEFIALLLLLHTSIVAGAKGG